MANIDLMSILPLLSGGKNPDMAQILSAMGKTQAPPAPPPQAPPMQNNSPNNRADYSKLYPNTPINDLPRADNARMRQPPPQSASQGPDMSSMLQMIAALNASKKQNAPPPSPAQAPIAPTAPREIQDSLRAILTLNELGGEIGGNGPGQTNKNNANSGQ